MGGLAQQVSCCVRVPVHRRHKCFSHPNPVCHAFACVQICLLLSCGTRAVDCVSKDVYLLGDPCAATGRRSARKQTAHELSRNTPLHHTIKLGRCVDGAEKPEVMAGQFNVGCWLGMLQATPNCIIIWGNANASVEVWSRRPMKVYPGQDGASFPGLLLLDNDTQLIREVSGSCWGEVGTWRRSERDQLAKVLVTAPLPGHVHPPTP